MSSETQSTASPPHPLIGALDAEVLAEVSALQAEAEARASEIVAEARRRGLRRFKAAAASLRAERAAALVKAKARAMRARHEVFLADNSRLLEAGLADIEASLHELWEAPEARAAWCRNAVALACERLGDIERFAVEHPDPLPDGTREVIVKAMSDACCRSPELRPDTGLRAGLRLTADHACLDATPAGLMQDRDRIAGEYLAVLGRGVEQADG